MCPSKHSNPFGCAARASVCAALLFLVPLFLNLGGGDAGMFWWSLIAVSATAAVFFGVMSSKPGRDRDLPRSFAIVVDVTTICMAIYLALIVLIVTTFGFRSFQCILLPVSADEAGALFKDGECVALLDEGWHWRSPFLESRVMKTGRLELDRTFGIRSADGVDGEAYIELIWQIEGDPRNLLRQNVKPIGYGEMYLLLRKAAQASAEELQAHEYRSKRAAFASAVREQLELETADSHVRIIYFNVGGVRMR